MEQGEQETLVPGEEPPQRAPPGGAPGRGPSPQRHRADRQDLRRQRPDDRLLAAAGQAQYVEAQVGHPLDELVAAVEEPR